MFALLSMSLLAAPERYRLYTKPDPEATGGIKGTVEYPSKRIEQILAIPPDEPRLVYEGKLWGTRRHKFFFEGLPMRKYDLVVIYNDSFYEGFKLERAADTLSKDDRDKIKTTIDRAEPFFTRKTIHRLEGTTGRGNLCRCICTYLRDRASSNGPGGERYIRRTFKLVMLKDVGPGWQVVRARDLYPTWTSEADMHAKHHYRKALSGIRVTRDTKDVGMLNLRSP